MDHGLASEGVTAVVWLLITILIVAVASRFTRVPYTIALVIAGLIIALSPINFTVNLTPDLILFIFLPALLFESSYNLSINDVRANLRPIALLAVPGVLLTALFLAAALHYTTGVTWETSFLFGAIMSATDPVSVLAIFKRLGAPRRLATILEGESLFNDGTALVIFRIVLAIVITGQLADPVSTVEQFVVVVAGALALGVLVGYGVSMLLTRVNQYLVETTVTLVVAYGTYLLAERIGVSGVIAVVVAGLVVGNFGRNAAMSPTTTLAVHSTWEFFGFLANSLIFLLIGLELKINQMSPYFVPTLIAIALVLLVRALVVVGASRVLRVVDRPLPFKWQGVLVWGGLRGSVALAMALSLPFELSSGKAFPDRDLLQVMTFGVILFSLLVQGLSMAPVMAKLGITEVQGWRTEFEALRVRRTMSRAALDELEQIRIAGICAPDVIEKLRDHYLAAIATVDESLRDLHLREDDLSRENVRAVKRRVVQVEKGVVLSQYREGTISADTMHELLAELDSQLYSLDTVGDPHQDELSKEVSTEAEQPEPFGAQS